MLLSGRGNHGRALIKALKRVPNPHCATPRMMFRVSVIVECFSCHRLLLPSWGDYRKDLLRQWFASRSFNLRSVMPHLLSEPTDFYIIIWGHCSTNERHEWMGRLLLTCHYGEYNAIMNEIREICRTQFVIVEHMKERHNTLLTHFELQIRVL